MNSDGIDRQKLLEFAEEVGDMIEVYGWWVADRIKEIVEETSAPLEPPPFDPDSDLIDHLEGSERTIRRYVKRAEQMRDAAARPLSEVDLSTPAALRESVRVFRAPSTTNTMRGHIRHAWVAAGIPNQFAAMVRATEQDSA